MNWAGFGGEKEANWEGFGTDIYGFWCILEKSKYMIKVWMMSVASPCFVQTLMTMDFLFPRKEGLWLLILLLLSLCLVCVKKVRDEERLHR